MGLETSTMSDNYQTYKDEYGETPLMFWIRERQGEAIPECLYYDGGQTDRNHLGYTPLMMWIDYRKGKFIP